MTRTNKNRKNRTDIVSAVPSDDDATKASSSETDISEIDEVNNANDDSVTEDTTDITESANEDGEDVEDGIVIINHASSKKPVKSASNGTNSRSPRKTSNKRTAVKIGDNTVTGRKPAPGKSSRNSHLSNHDLKNGKTILTTVVSVAVIIILGLSIALSITASNNSESTEADENAMETTLTAFDYTMPKDAASEALQWFDDTLVSYDDAMKDGYLDSDDASSDLANLADGDDSKIPDSIKNAFYWNTDVMTEGKTVDEQTLKAAGYTAIMSSWQLRTTARQQSPDLSLNKNLVYVDRTHGTVTIPAEAWCGLPAELVIQLVWNGKDWKIDGTSVATQITTRVRAAQLKSMTSGDSSSE